MGSRRRVVAEARRSRRLGNGVIQRSVLDALAAAGRPMSVDEVQMAVEALLCHPVSRDSVNSCLSTGVRGLNPIFERIGLGRYRLMRSR
jgi:flagellar biosynthesis/type III secretory pathway ATPase